MDDDFGDFATAGWDAQFGVDVSVGGTGWDKPDRTTNGAERKTEIISNEVRNPDVESPIAGWNPPGTSDIFAPGSSRPMGNHQDNVDFGNFSGFGGNGDIAVGTLHDQEPSRTEGSGSSVSGVEKAAWPGEPGTTVQDGKLLGEASFAEFGNFSLANLKGIDGGFEGVQPEGQSGSVMNDAGHLNDESTNQDFATTVISENPNNTFAEFTTASNWSKSETSDLDQLSDVQQSGSLFGSELGGFGIPTPTMSVGGMEANQMKQNPSMVGDEVIGTVNFSEQGQSAMSADGVISSDNVFAGLGPVSLGTQLSFDGENTDVAGSGFGQFNSSMEHLTGRTAKVEAKNELEQDIFGQLESSEVSGTGMMSSEGVVTQVVVTEERGTDTNTQQTATSSIEQEQQLDTFCVFDSTQGGFTVAGAPSSVAPSVSCESEGKPDDLFGDLSSSQGDGFAAFTSAPSVESEDQPENVFGDFSSSPGDGFATFTSDPSAASSSGVSTSGQHADDEFGAFNSSASTDFGDFSVSSSNTAGAFGQGGSTGQSTFGVFTSSPQPQPVAQPLTPQQSVGQALPQPYTGQDSESVQRVLMSTFTVMAPSDGVQCEFKQLELHLTRQTGADWDQLKKASDEVKGRFNLKDCETHQLLMDMLHVDVHAVLSPGFGGAPFQVFGNVGWLESELSSPVMDQLAVPVANTLLDLSASPVPPAAPFGTQVVGAAQAQLVVPEIVGAVPTTETVDVGMLDLDFFGPSPASPATPSTGEMGGGLAMADLLALGLILEPAARALGTATPPESKESILSSDPLAKVFALAGQSTHVWSLPRPVSGDELSSEAAVVVASLPDLSFMHSTVLMFPMLLSSVEHPVSQTTGPSDTFSSGLL